jgi:hypothetical protein
VGAREKLPFETAAAAIGKVESGRGSFEGKRNAAQHYYSENLLGERERNEKETYFRTCPSKRKIFQTKTPPQRRNL